MKKFFVSLLFVCVFSVQAFSAEPGYNRETGEIILPSEVSLEGDFSPAPQNDIAEIHAAEAQ